MVKLYILYNNFCMYNFNHFQFLVKERMWFYQIIYLFLAFICFYFFYILYITGAILRTLVCLTVQSVCVINGVWWLLKIISGKQCRILKTWIISVYAIQPIGKNTVSKRLQIHKYWERNRWPCLLSKRICMHPPQICDLFSLY